MTATLLPVSSRLDTSPLAARDTLSTRTAGLSFVRFAVSRRCARAPSANLENPSPQRRLDAEPGGRDRPVRGDRSDPRGPTRGGSAGLGGIHLGGAARGPIDHLGLDGCRLGSGRPPRPARPTPPRSAPPPGPACALQLHLAPGRLATLHHPDKAAALIDCVFGRFCPAVANRTSMNQSPARAAGRDVHRGPARHRGAPPGGDHCRRRSAADPGQQLCLGGAGREGDPAPGGARSAHAGPGGGAERGRVGRAGRGRAARSGWPRARPSSPR